MPKSEVVTRGDSNLSNLMLFELSYGGHYPEYLTHLIRYWCEQQLQGLFSIVVSPQFMHRHPEVVQIGIAKSNQNIQFIPITDDEAAALTTANNTYKRIKRAFQEFKLAQKYAKSFKAKQILFTYFDTRQFPLALGQKISGSVSGIYFRPRFHYADFGSIPLNWRERLTVFQEWLLLKATLNRPEMENLFCLDPFAAKQLAQLNFKAKIIPLADPIEIDSNFNINREQLKIKLSIQPQRKVLLLFGGLTKRKGILPLLEALELLTPQESQKICLLLVGTIAPEFKDKIEPQISRLSNCQDIQIIRDYGYVTQTATQEYFQLADIILALYQRHIGMSGILMRAAAVQKPVLSSNYGLMGEITRRYQLGIDADAANPEAIASKLKQLLSKPAREFANRDAMKLFASQNSAAKFSETIFNNLNIT